MIDDEYTEDDLRGTLRALSWRWRWLLESLTPDEVAGVEAILRETAEAVGAADADLPAIDAAATSLPPARRRDAIERTEELLSRAGRLLAPEPARGTVAGLFASGGGVPKHPIPEARIGRRGVDGDRQASRKHHGRVFQALCLWSAEVVDCLASEGHLIGPGSAGENILVRGLDWSSLRIGVRLHLGDAVVAELTSWAPPCKKNAQWFVGGDFRRIDHDRHPGWSRAYASVLAGGTVRVGDPVVTS